MKFNLRKTFFWLTIVCIAAALLRRPILCAFDGSGFFRYIWVGFYPLCWLVGCESWIELPPVEAHAMSGFETLGAVAGVFGGGAVQIVAIVLLIGFAMDVYQRCKDQP